MSTSRGPKNQTPGKVYALSRAVSSRILEELPPKHLSMGSYVPLDVLAGRFGIIIKDKPSEVDGALSEFRQMGLEGVARKSTLDSEDGRFEWSRPAYEIHILSRGSRARFTAAHEIAHVVLTEYFSSYDAELSISEREAVCDSVARQVLLPVYAVQEQFMSAASAELDIEKIERFSIQMKASLPVVISRLRELSDERIVTMPAILILARLDRSRKRRDNLAPRVATWCGPTRWFVPVNSRLSSIGLVGLHAAFDQAPLYKLRKLRETLFAWDYFVGRRSRVGCNITFKCYKWSSTQADREDSRIMLAVLRLDEEDTSGLL